MTGRASTEQAGGPDRSAGRSGPPSHGVRAWLTATLVIAGGKLVSLLPETLAWHLGSAAGLLEYAASPSRRACARRNLRRVVEWMAAGELGAEKYRRAASDHRALEALVRSAFRHHGHYTMELVRAGRFDADYVTQRLLVETPREVEEWLTRRRALILLGMHFGAIEMPGFLAVKLLGRIAAPMETVANPRIQRYVLSTRARIGVRILTLEEAPRELLATLKRNEPVGLVADRDLTGGGIEAEFFGAATRIPAGPAFLAVESGAPMYAAAVRRDGPGRYRGSLYQVPVPGGADRRGRIRAIVREEARIFERFVMQAPEQWLASFHAVWPDLEQVAAAGKRSA